jgi:peptidoglycan/LPS O-acetylase OafA/YrhL
MAKRIVEIDSLRGVAAISIMVFHYFYNYNIIYGHVNIPVNWALYAFFGVDLFFIISGYVIYWTLHRIKKPLDFIISRFSRLYPAYWCAILLTFLAVHVFNLQGREISIKNAIGNLFMLHEYFHIPHVDGVYWTLTVEITFYLWMFLCYLAGRLNQADGVLFALVLCSILEAVGIIQVPVPLKKILLMEHVPFFMLGISLFKIKNKIKIKRSITLFVFCLASVILIHDITRFFIASLLLGIFFLAISGRLKLLRNELMVFIGTISYSLYLIHQNIGYIIIGEFYRKGLNPFIGILCAFAFSVSLATFLYKFIEKPCMNVIRNHYSGVDKG